MQVDSIESIQNNIFICCLRQKT